MFLFQKVSPVPAGQCHDPGEWVGDMPVIVGVADKYPILNETKIKDLENYCITNYVDMIDGLNLDRRKFRINISIEGIDYLCGPPVPDVTISKTERFGILSNNKIVRVNVWVW